MFPQEGINNPSQLAGVSDSLAHLAVHQPPPQQITYAPPAPAPAPRPAPQAYAPGPFDAPPPAAWAISSEDKQRYDTVFNTLNPTNGFISGAAVRPVLERSGLAVDMLRQGWNLSDIDRDGHLDADEFAVAMHLTRELASGSMPSPPAALPPDMMPPSKR
mmetsp:Transcript_36802/g.64720  ORF Transcript_36802/g.64720 Transcript_36802/m.64720 type:complete len:160 (+) Transcript_36802:1-480(+)